jgi:hypothetical protein
MWVRVPRRTPFIESENMTSRDFCYWLQGFFELTDSTEAYIDDRKADLIRRHLNMVFIHEIDPSFPADQQDALTEAHTMDIESYSPNPRFIVKC